MKKEHESKVWLSPTEEKVYRAMQENDACPYIFEYAENEYSKYCMDCKEIIAEYVFRAGLPYESINRIFEKHFMYTE